MTEYDASPLNNVTADEPLLLILNRDRDIQRLLDQAKVFLEALRVRGKTVELPIVTNRTHATIIASTVEQWDQTMRLGLQFTSAIPSQWAGL